MACLLQIIAVFAYFISMYNLMGTGKIELNQLIGPLTFLMMCKTSSLFISFATFFLVVEIYLLDLLLYRCNIVFNMKLKFATFHFPITLEDVWLGLDNVVNWWFWCFPWVIIWWCCITFNIVGTRYWLICRWILLDCVGFDWTNSKNILAVLFLWRVPRDPFVT